MSDSWDDRRRAQEEGYFEAMNKQALARLAQKKGQPARKSPVTDKPMELVTVMGVVVDRCVDSGGIWLDAGELGQLLESAKNNPASLNDFIKLIPPAAGGVQTAPTDVKSPISGKPMTQDKVLGVTIGRCTESGGLWLDSSELKRLVESAHQTLSSDVKEFFAQVVGQK